MSKVIFLLFFLFFSVLSPLSTAKGDCIGKASNQQMTTQFRLKCLSQETNPGFNYVQLKFRDFPLSILWSIKKIAPSLKKEVPSDLEVGLKQTKGQGQLVFSYNKQGESVQLKMSLTEEARTNDNIAAADPSKTLFNLEKTIRKPSTDLVTEALTDFFIYFCDTWEKNRLMNADERTASLEKTHNYSAGYAL